MENTNNLPNQSTKNLPANREINLFTSSKNVDNIAVQKVLELITEAKKIRIKGLKNINAWLYADVENLSLDTLMYLYEHYKFEPPFLKSAWDNNIYICSQLKVNHVTIRIESIKTKINILPNDVKQIIMQ